MTNLWRTGVSYLFQKTVALASVDKVGAAAPWLILLTYTSLVCFGVSVHEPWFDEAQSWLLVRDSSLLELLSERLRFEGHPPLWYLLLTPFIKLGYPYAGLGFISAGLGVLGTSILVFDRRIPLIFRAAVPFTFFLGYQYAVVARSYILFYPLLMGLVRLWPRPFQHSLLFGAMLGLLSTVSLHGLFIAIAIGIYALFQAWQINELGKLESRQLILGMSLFFVGALIAIYVSRPAPNLAIQPKLDICRSHFWKLLPGTALRIGTTLAESTWIGVSLGLGILAWLFVRQRMGIALFLLGCLLPLFTIYMNHWHEGIIALVILFPVLLASMCETPRTGAKCQWLAKIGAVSLSITGCIQIYWTLSTVIWDKNNAYSGAREVAHILSRETYQRKNIVALGFTTLSIQPFFSSNIYMNYRLPQGAAYWHWGTPTPLFYAPSFILDRNAMAQWTRDQLALDPDLIIVSLKYLNDQIYVNEIKQYGGFKIKAVAQGKLFWKIKPIESETFVVFSKSAPSDHNKCIINSPSPA